MKASLEVEVGVEVRVEVQWLSRQSVSNTPSWLNTEASTRASVSHPCLLGVLGPEKALCAQNTVP